MSGARSAHHNAPPGSPDFITTAVIREGLASIVREMRRSMIRSSYSSIIYEGYDFSCVIIDGTGQLLAQSGEDHPFHIIPVAASVRNLLDRGRAIGPDDTFLHNDPYSGGTHLNDVAVVWPVFDGAAVAFFIVIRSHWADVGGTTPGSLSGGAREILQEGLRLDNLRVGKSGESEVLRLIFDNVRVSDEAMSDFHAVLGILRVAETRLRGIMERYGAVVLAGAIADLLDSSERRMRAVIDELPDGIYPGTAYLDGNDAAHFPLRVSVALRVSGDAVHADFAGTSGQIAAPLNAGPAIAVTSVLTILKSFLDPAGIITSGTLRPITVDVPERTILNARFPAPCGGLNEVRFAADAAMLAALAQMIPEQVTGDVRGTSNHTYIGGFDERRGKPFIFYEYPSGGTGGWANHDGNPAVRAFNEGENVSIQSAEVVEATFPLRILQNELRPDSGGAGTFRGGCGLVRRVEVLGDSGQLSVLSDRNLIPPAGVNGGRSGAANAYAVCREGVEMAPSAFPGKVTGFPLLRGDVVVMRSSGGGGFGPAAGRDAGRLREDVADGVVTDQGPYAVVAGDEAPAGIAWPGGLEAETCDVSEGLADQLGLTPGQLVELVVAAGPAVRVWVGVVRPGNAPRLFLAEALTGVVSGTSVVVRAMGYRHP